MAYVLVGLGNPEARYEGTRHNVGRMALEQIRAQSGFSEWKQKGKGIGLVAEGKLGKESVVLLLPEVPMNRSGVSVAKFVKSVKAAERLVVLHDELDLPLGALKLAFNRGSGGHRGVESVMRSLKTKKFTRVRIGISPKTPGGKLKKPHGEKEVVAFVLGSFRAPEQVVLKKALKRAAEAASALVTEGREAAMGTWNAS